MNTAQKTSTIAAAALVAATIGPVAHASAATRAAATAKTQKFKGPLVDNRWGGIQVTISVKNKKITGVSAAVSPHTNRSVFIDEQAIPLLKQEVLSAQSANIDTISGATDTSAAYSESLLAAVQSAVKHKALKSSALG